MDQLRPYERQDGESDAAWLAFQTFRGLGPHERSVVAAYRTQNRRHIRNAPSYWLEWAKRWDWERRAAFWDADQDAHLRREQTQELLAARRRQADTFADFQQVLAQPVLELVSRIKAGLFDFKMMGSGDLYKLAVFAARVMPALADAELRSRGDVAPTDAPWTGEARQVPMDDERMAAIFAVLQGAGVDPLRVVEASAEVHQLPRAAGE